MQSISAARRLDPMWCDARVNGYHVKDSAGAVTAGSYLEATAYSNTGAPQGLYVLKVEKPSTARSSGLHMKGRVVVAQDENYARYSKTRGKPGGHGQGLGFPPLCL